MVIPVCLEVVALFSNPAEKWWMFPTLVHSSSFVILGTAFWAIACRALQLVANQQSARLAADYQVLDLP